MDTYRSMAKPRYITRKENNKTDSVHDQQAHEDSLDSNDPESIKYETTFVGVSFFSKKARMK